MSRRGTSPLGLRLAELAAGGDPTLAAAARALTAAGRRESEPAAALFVPGRIEVLGKHTDYAGGRSLVAATEQGFRLLAAPRGDARLRLFDLASGETVEIPFASDAATSGWALYPAAVARRLVRDFGILRGADIAFASDLPAAAGASSSSAFVVAVFLALATANDLTSAPAYQENLATVEALADYLGAVESGTGFGPFPGVRGIGVASGCEDHAAILLSRAGALGQFRYLPVQRERSIPLPDGLVFTVAASGVAAEKAGAARHAYNRIARLAREAAAVWRRTTGGDEAHLGAVAAGGHASRARLLAVLSGAAGGRELLRRAEHFLAESEEIVPAAGNALAAGDLAGFGRWVDRSQDLAERLLGNQVPETIALARTARELGAHAASAFGAGFGGSVWALVDEARAADFLAAWSTRYRAAFPERSSCRFFTTSAAGPAREQTASRPGRPAPGGG